MTEFFVSKFLNLVIVKDPWISVLEFNFFSQIFISLSGAIIYLCPWPIFLLLGGYFCLVTSNRYLRPDYPTTTLK